MKVHGKRRGNDMKEYEMTEYIAQNRSALNKKTCPLLHGSPEEEEE